MSEPLSGAVAAASALTGASLYVLLTGIDYGVMFGAFAGAVFSVATAADLSIFRRSAYFIIPCLPGVTVPGWLASCSQA